MKHLLRCSSLLTAALLLPAASAQAVPPTPDFANLPAYFKALNQSTDPDAIALRARIAAGPADLARERVLTGKAGIATRPGQLVQPLPPADQNAAPLYIQLDALRKQKPLYFPFYAQSLNGRYAYTPAQIAAVQQKYDARQDVFTLLHQAADKSQCAFDDERLKGFSISFAKYPGLREDARELKTESLLLAFQGKYPQAAANQERGFRIAAHLASGPRLIGFLTASAIDAITVSGLQDILEKSGPDAALDTRISADILALPLLSLVSTLSGSHAEADTEFAMIRQDSSGRLAQVFPHDSPFFVDHPTPPRFTPTEQAQLGLLVDAAEADYLHQLRLLVAAADLPGAARHLVFEAAAARAKANRTDPIEALSDLLNPASELDLGQDADRVTARRSVVAAGAAVLATKAQAGAFPSALPTQFIDPYTGKPLGYRVEGPDGFVVYSAGPAGTFGGGKPGDIYDNTQILFRYPLVLVPVPPER